MNLRETFVWNKQKRRRGKGQGILETLRQKESNSDGTLEKCDREREVSVMDFSVSLFFII